MGLAVRDRGPEEEWLKQGRSALMSLRKAQAGVMATQQGHWGPVTMPSWGTAQSQAHAWDAGAKLCDAFEGSLPWGAECVSAVKGRRDDKPALIIPVFHRNPIELKV